MGEIATNFTFLFLSLGLAILGTLVGGWLQERSWKQRQWEKLRADRTQAALATVKRASELIDRRLYRQRRLLWAIRRGDAEEIETERREYRSAVFNWMDSLGSLKAELWAGFDRWTAINFEAELHDRFARNGARLELALRTGQGTSLNYEERDLNSLGRSSYEFTQRLLGRIQREELNGLLGHFELSYDNWENLNSTFLLARLFGLAPPR